MNAEIGVFPDPSSRSKKKQFDDTYILQETTLISLAFLAMFLILIVP
jgi:hypothetical protein